MPLLKIPDNIQEDNVDGDYKSEVEDDNGVPMCSLIACMIGSEKGVESYGTLEEQGTGKNEGNNVVIDSSRRLRKPSSRLQAYAKNTEYNMYRS
ncbi:hypothetical protein M422DRAFT_243844 [Sphaerobolus stellatus SS14]|nr:hypothetical protein M422DRAFT_243844 [Sphaerobolus stellatus SS14]